MDVITYYIHSKSNFVKPIYASNMVYENKYSGMLL